LQYNAARDCPFISDHQRAYADSALSLPLCPELRDDELSMAGGEVSSALDASEDAAR
jgi:hypothetical protein